MSAKRKPDVTVEAPARSAASRRDTPQHEDRDWDRDWTPLHPMHVDLAGRMSSYPPPVVTPYPRPVRAALVIGAATASWMLFGWAARGVIGIFGS